VAHVWQNQIGGPDYIHDALSSQFWALLSTGNAANAYNWRAALAAGASFETMNDEQRARLMEDIGRALRGDDKITRADADLFGPNFTPAEVRFMRAVWADIRRGEGTH
jgi:hypothetical protein